MNKSAISFHMLYMIPRLFFLIFVVLVIVFMLNGFRDVGYQEAIYAEQQMFSEWIIYSTNGVSYFDPNLNTVLPGIINVEDCISGLTEYRLNHSMSYGDKNKHISARITILDRNKNDVIGRSIYYNEGKGKSYGFTFWEPLSQMRGEGASSYFIRTLPCLLITPQTPPNQYERGNIIIEIVIPNYENV